MHELLVESCCGEPSTKNLKIAGLQYAFALPLANFSIAFSVSTARTCLQPNLLPG
jgi:hypothetical protein